MYGAVKPTFALRDGVIVIAAIAKSHDFGPFATSLEKSGSSTKRTVFTPSFAASARARSGSRPLAKTTFVPCTAPACRPGAREAERDRQLARHLRRRRGSRGERGRGQRERSGEDGGEPHRDVPSTVTGVPTWRRSYSHFMSPGGTRTQPCDAGYGGTSAYSWKATPPTK